MKFYLKLLATTAMGVMLSMPLAALAQDIKGAGSRFADPVLQRWADMAKGQAGLQVVYAPIGSVNGHSRLLAREIDFAASDSPMPAGALENDHLVQFPIAVGAIVPVVNVPGIGPDQLKLNGVLLAKIYTGKIKNWSDPEIAAANPGVKLPAMDIRPVSQTEFAGPTHTFTQYLLAANADWREKFGAAVTKRWALGSAVAGNIEMFEVMKTLPGSIGYLDYSVAVVNNLTTVQLQTKAGKYLPPSPSDFAATLASVNWDSAPDMVFNLVNLPGDKAWPLLTPLYVQMPSDPKDPERNAKVLKFFEFALTSGGSAVRGQRLVPLPAAARPGIRQQWAKIHT